MKKIVPIILLIISATTQAEEVMIVEITRFAFTGEHYLFNTAERELLFKTLFENGQLNYLSFKASDDEPSQLDFAAKTAIGKEMYELIFESKQAIYDFVEETLPANPDYELFGGLERGVFIAIRDYAIKQNDERLTELLLAKQNSDEYKNSVDETLEALYLPLLKNYR